MKIKSFSKWLLADCRKGIIIFSGVILAIFSLAAILDIIFPNTGTISGMESSSIIFVLILGIVLVREALHMALGNGISRKTTLLSIILFMLALSVLFSIALTIFGALFGRFSNVISLFGDLFPGTSSFLSILFQILFSICIHFSYSMLGVFISLTYYRMNKATCLLVSIGVPVFLLVLLPIGISLLPESFIAAVLPVIINIISTLFGAPWRAALTALAISAIFSFFSWLLIRRAPLRV